MDNERYKSKSMKNTEKKKNNDKKDNNRKKKRESSNLAVIITIAVMIVIITATVFAIKAVRNKDKDKDDAGSSGSSYTTSSMKSEGDFIYYEGDSGEIAIKKYTGNSKKAEVPEQINGKQVVYIFDDAFSGNKTIEEVILPSGIREVLDGVFSGCSNLRSITIHSGLEGIGKNSFFGCTSLSEVKFFGTAEQYSAMVSATMTGNDAFTSVPPTYMSE